MADFNLINDIAAKACGIAPSKTLDETFLDGMREGWNSAAAASKARGGWPPPKRDGWPSYDVVPAQPVVLSQAQQTFITIARGAARMLSIAADDMERNSMVAAERSRHQAYELVRQLGPLVLEAHEELCGPATFCESCGDIEELCACEGDVRW